MHCNKCQEKMKIATWKVGIQKHYCQNITCDKNGLYQDENVELAKANII